MDTVFSYLKMMKNSQYRDYDMPCNMCISKIFPNAQDVFMTNEHYNSIWKPDVDNQGVIYDYITMEEKFEEIYAQQEKKQQAGKTAPDEEASENEDGEDNSEEDEEEEEEEEDGNEDDDADVTMEDKDTMKDQGEIRHITEKFAKKYLNGAHANVRYVTFNTHGVIIRAFEKKLMTTTDKNSPISHVQCHHAHKECVVGQVMRKCHECRHKWFIIPKEICMNLWILRKCKKELNGIVLPLYSAVYVVNSPEKENGWRLLFQTDPSLLNIEQMLRLNKEIGEKKQVSKIYPPENIAQQILDAVVKLHKSGISHNELRTDNMIVLKAGRSVRVVIIDFDSADWESSFYISKSSDFKPRPYAVEQQWGRMRYRDPFALDRYSAGLVALCVLGTVLLRSIKDNSMLDIITAFQSGPDGLGPVYEVVAGAHPKHTKGITEHCSSKQCLYCECFFNFMGSEFDEVDWFIFDPEERQAVQKKRGRSKEKELYRD